VREVKSSEKSKIDKTRVFDFEAMFKSIVVGRTRVGVFLGTTLNDHVDRDQSTGYDQLVFV
jgi:hypothetical protein